MASDIWISSVHGVVINAQGKRGGKSAMKAFHRALYDPIRGHLLLRSQRPTSDTLMSKKITNSATTKSAGLLYAGRF